MSSNPDDRAYRQLENAQPDSTLHVRPGSIDERLYWHWIEPAVSASCPCDRHVGETRFPRSGDRLEPKKESASTSTSDTVLREFCASYIASSIPLSRYEVSDMRHFAVIAVSSPGSSTRCIRMAATTRKTPPATTAVSRLLCSRCDIIHPNARDAMISGSTIKKLNMPM